MAFVSVPKDLNRVKTRIILNLTKRQLICFGSAAAIGVPAYIFTRGAIGNSAAALLMIATMFPFFFIGIYEKDGLPAEKILQNIVRVRFVWPNKRPYKTENLYEILEKGASPGADQSKTATGAAVGKRPAGKRKPRRHEKNAEQNAREERAARVKNGRLA
jgi:hypothetical protein